MMGLALARLFGQLSTTLWYSEKFQSVSLGARLLYVWLQTNEGGNGVGVFVGVSIP